MSLRTLALIGDTDGPNMWRVKAPFAALQEQGYPAEWGSNSDPAVHAAATLFRPDVVVLPRLSWLPEHYDRAERFVASLHRAGACVVYESDDDLFSEHVVVRQIEHAGLTKKRTPEQLEQERQDRVFALRLCDGVTVTTPRLATVVRTLTDKPVEIVPNAIDLCWWRAVQRHADRVIPGLTIGWAGGARPDRDLEAMAEAWARIAARYPAVTFVVMGHQPPPLDVVPQDRIRRIPWLPVEEYPLGYANIDIGCCPLADTQFNRCKSPIKAFEYAASGAAVVASPLLYRSVIEDDHSGYLCETVDEWENALMVLIESESRRRMFARRLLRTVEKHHSLDTQVWRWPAAWSRIREAFDTRQKLLLAA